MRFNGPTLPAVLPGKTKNAYQRGKASRRPRLRPVRYSPSLASPLYKVVPIQYALALAVRRAFCFQF